MNFSIRGKLEKEYSGWKINIQLLDCEVRDVRPLSCLRKLENRIKEELGDPLLKIFFKINDSGTFYLITAQTPEFIDFIADRINDLSTVKIEASFDD